MKDKTFGDVSRLPYIEGMKPDYDYSHLNEHGLIPEETPVDDKTVLIGQSTLADVNTGKHVDCSKTPKKGQLGIVDKSFLTEDEEGKRIAKIRIPHHPLFSSNGSSIVLHMIQTPWKWVIWQTQ